MNSVGLFELLMFSEVGLLDWIAVIFVLSKHKIL